MHHVEFAFFFLVVRGYFKILYIYMYINFPAYKDYLCSNFKWFDSHAKISGEKNGKNVILGHIAFCIVVFQQLSVYLWPAWYTKSEKQQFFWFFLEGNFTAIF